MLVLQQVLIRTGGGRFPRRLLDHGRRRNHRLGGRRAAAGGHRHGVEEVPFRRPIERSPEAHVHEIEVRQSPRRRGRDVQYPELHGRVGVVRESHRAPVRRPARVADARILGQAGHGALFTVERAKRETVRGPRAAGAVRARVDAQSGDPQFRRRDFGDRRQAGPHREQHHRLVGTQADPRGRRGVDERGEFGGRRLVSVRPLLRGDIRRGRGEEEGEGEGESKDSRAVIVSHFAGSS